MKTFMRNAVVSAFFSAALSSQVMAVEILKKEPGVGEMRAGQPVYVESSKCSKGQVMRVMAGTTHRTASTARIRECVDKPS